MNRRRDVGPPRWWRWLFEPASSLESVSPDDDWSPLCVLFAMVLGLLVFWPFFFLIFGWPL